MRYWVGDSMENIVVDNIVYDRIFRYDNNSIFKISSLSLDACKSLQEKNLSFVNTPIGYRTLTDDEDILYNKDEYANYQSVIILPFLTEYKTLYEQKFTEQFDTTDLLKLLRKNLELLSKLHKNDIYHGDIFSENIMINRNLDINFIDLDAAIIDDFISVENEYFSTKIDIEQAKYETKISDKLNLLDTYFTSLYCGRFMDFNYYCIRDMSLLEENEKAMIEFRRGENISDDYYFLDFIDDLLEQGYEAPAICAKKILKKYR